MAVQWTSQQRQVIETRNRNLLVAAAAGSGKTAVLVERIIQMISAGERPLNVDQLLVMTFTSAAAAEMRERIGAAVERLLKEDPENEHLWLQEALISQAQITTIDSFCLNLIRNHYDVLDIDPAFRIGDEGELSLLRTDVLKAMLEEQYEAGGEAFSAFVEQFGRGKSDEGIEEVILKAWTFSQSHPWPEEWVAACVKEAGEERLEEMEKSPWLRFILSDVALQMEELKGQLSEALEVCGEENGPQAYATAITEDLRSVTKALEAAGEGSYRALYEALSGISFGRLTAIRSKEVDGEKKAFVSACRDRVKKAVGKCKELYGAQPPDEMAEAVAKTGPVIRELLRLVQEFDTWYKERKRERNVLDFNDLEHLALEILWEEEEGEPGGRRPTQTAKELSAQYEEILVDEYQDSNMVQEALILGISREREGTPNVFMVGDVKQSIYRFRLARPELFMEKYDTYTQEESLYQKIELRQNFRSRATVLESVNHVFYRIMTKALGGIRYTPETALNPGAVFPPMEGAGTPTELLLVDTGAEALSGLDEEAMDYTAKEVEARLVAAKIKEMTHPERGLMVWDKGMEGYRRARLGDMVILLRSLSGWSEVFVNVLMNEGIPAYAQTKTGYFNTVEVETVLSMLAVIDNPMQDIPLAALMRSPVIGMTDEELAWLVAAYKRGTDKGEDRGLYGAWKMWEKRGDEGISVPPDQAAALSGKLLRLGQFLEGLGREARYLPVHELLYRVYQESGYYDYVSVMPGGETRRANLDMLVEKAIAYEATSYKGLFHFIRYIEKLKKYNTDFGEANTAGEQENTVRIMSIHKSKGLEFPVVFLAGMGKRFNKQDAYSTLLMDGDLGLGTDFLELERRLKTPTLKKQAIRRRLELEAMGEELRVLYVAMTRAKEKLVMTAADRSLASKLEKWESVPLNKGEVPYTILSGAGSFLDWLLMSVSGGPIQVSQVPVRELVGREVRRQALRIGLRDELMGLDLERVYSPGAKEAIERAAAYSYPYGGDTGLYAMLSVSELKKQSQAGQDEEEIGRAPIFAAAGQGKEGGGAFRGSAYHRALELMPFGEVKSREETKKALEEMVRRGDLQEEVFQLLEPDTLWELMSGRLGKRLAAARLEGRLYRERQFMIGLPARSLGRGDSEELVLVQGVIDAYMEEEDGLVLVDYKTDRVPFGKEGEEVLRKRYSFQVECYERALEQVTGRKVKERVIYSIGMQREVRV